MNRPALSVRKLTVKVREKGGLTAVVEGIDFDLGEGEVLAIVGESGSGKSKTAEAIMGLVANETGTVSADAMLLGDTDLAGLKGADMQKVRGRDISMVFQEPLTALDPVFSCGHQLATIYRRHRGQSRRDALASARQMLSRVGFPDPDRVMQSYPHRLSGGMRQRVLIAMAMACRPRVLIADEPTTALDVTTQASVLSRLVSLGRENGTAILLITHDLGIVAHYCDRALVMREGRIVEQATVRDLFDNPAHEYTQALLLASREMNP